MEVSKVFRTGELDAQKIGEAVAGFLKSKKQMQAEGVKTPEGYFVQARTVDNGWKKIAGMSAATQVQIIQTGEFVTISIGKGEWSDKVGAGVVGAIVFAPLAVTALVGANMQRKLPQEIFEFVEQFIFSGGKSIYVTNSVATNNGVICPSCGKENTPGQKFCGTCGAALGKKCPNCGSNVSLDKKFCPECGNALSSKKICPDCGTELADSQKFCSECGHKF